MNQIIRIFLISILLSCNTKFEGLPVLESEPETEWTLILYSDSPDTVSVKITTGHGSWGNKEVKFKSIGIFEYKLPEYRLFAFGNWYYNDIDNRLILKVPYYDSKLSYVLRLNGQIVSEQIETHQPRYESYEIR